MSNYIIIKPDELNHYGVKGMKWGVRKEYNPVGRRRGNNNYYLNNTEV